MPWFVSSWLALCGLMSVSNAGMFVALVLSGLLACDSGRNLGIPLFCVCVCVCCWPGARTARKMCQKTSRKNVKIDAESCEKTMKIEAKMFDEWSQN